MDLCTTSRRQKTNLTQRIRVYEKGGGLMLTGTVGGVRLNMSLCRGEESPSVHEAEHE